MWLFIIPYTLFTILTILINCNSIENKEQKHELYENIYLAKNVVPSEIKRRFIEIMKSAILKKPLLIGSKRKRNTEETDIELTGAIIILKNIDNEKSKSSKEKPIRINRSSIIGFKKYEPRFRSYIRKILMKILEKKGRRDIVARKGLSIEDSLHSVPITTMDPIKSNILRDKYGDACIKVAIRKCYKALLAVNKNVCKVRYKCKSSFKSYFKKKNKEGCIKEFDYSKGSSQEKKRTSSIFGGSTFVDATREGYLDACIPFMVPNYKVVRKSITLRNDTLSNVFTNVLRKSRSEKKCQRLSRSKCYKACGFALKETCSKYDCSSRRTRTFSKSCKEECKREYQVKSTSDSSDSSSGSD